MLIRTISAISLSLLRLPQLTAAVSPSQPERTDSSQHGYQADGWTPKPTSGPELFIQERQFSNTQVCGILRGNLEYSDYTYTCQTSEMCLKQGNWWGCCYRSPVPGCYEPQCPSVSSCVGYQQLSLCDRNCQSQTNILKCTDTHNPYCAVATVVSSTGSVYDDTQSKTGQKFFACEPSPYNLNFIAAATQGEPGECAPEWITNPRSLSAWSAANPSYSHSFGDPFRNLVASGAETTTSSHASSTTSGSNTLSFPTTSSPITTRPVTGSSGAEILGMPPHRMIICGFAVVVAFVS